MDSNSLRDGGAFDSASVKSGRSHERKASTAVGLLSKMSLRRDTRRPGSSSSHDTANPFSARPSLY